MTSTETTPTATVPQRVTPELIDRLTARVRASGDAHLGRARTPFTLIEVYTGAAYGTLPQSRPEDVADAFATARAAQRTWAATPLKERLAVFARAHELILTERATIADLIQIGCGKARRMAFEESCDVPMIISHYLKTARRILKPRKHGGPVPLLSASIEEHRPKGVVGVIAPWNFPFALALSDAVAALIAGNAVVLKPDNKTALCALFGVELLHRAGLPEGLFEVVCGEGPDIGGDLVDNSDFVMFTGSTATGRLIGERAGRNLIGCSLELGGKNPLIVLDDADLDAVIPGAVFATFANSGQACMHIERIYVHDRLYDEFLRRFVDAAADLGAKAGASYDYIPEFGSLISPEHLARVSAHVEEARAAGATVHTGGRARPDIGPAFYEPTVLTDVPPQVAHATAETFGPVVTVYRVGSEQEAIDRANATDYGLNASVWSSDRGRALRVARRLEAGNININDGFVTSYSAKATPSGGVKQSGIGARHGDQGLLKYTDTINVGVLKSQVITARAQMAYDKQITSTLATLRIMRRTRLR
ncbi:succinic semialdehyde dehydrogenase [Nocardia shimofusensis]|uniref:succinic semialdehyde dehydrogenase n=1 Tax=Nocardia shimofusensis TaxID=228596 RepID=UPI0008379487|nr:succinic semialdehyde dehydrogenase [Nocardia shimofusensis]